MGAAGARRGVVRRRRQRLELRSVLNSFRTRALAKTKLWALVDALSLPPGDSHEPPPLPDVFATGVRALYIRQDVSDAGNNQITSQCHRIPSLDLSYLPAGRSTPRKRALMTARSKP